MPRFASVIISTPGAATGELPEMIKENASRAEIPLSFQYLWRTFEFRNASFTNKIICARINQMRAMIPQFNL